MSASVKSEYPVKSDLCKRKNDSIINYNNDAKNTITVLWIPYENPYSPVVFM